MYKLQIWICLFLVMQRLYCAQWNLKPKRKKNHRESKCCGYCSLLLFLKKKITNFISNFKLILSEAADIWQLIIWKGIKIIQICVFNCVYYFIIIRTNTFMEGNGRERKSRHYNWSSVKSTTPEIINLNS